MSQNSAHGNTTACMRDACFPYGITILDLLSTAVMFVELY